jgi:hypothetical protein
MALDLEKAKSAAGIAQSAVISLAVIVGGIWTLITFNVMGEARKARQDYEKGEAELERMREGLKKSVVPEVRMSVEQSTLAGDGSFYLAALVDVDNTGSAIAELDLGSEVPFEVNRVEYEDDGDPEFQAGRSAWYHSAPNPNDLTKLVRIHPGGHKTLPFLVRLEKPGHYLVSFHALVRQVDPKSLSRKAMEEEIEEAPFVPWSTSMFVLVAGGADTAGGAPTDQ